MSTPTITRRTLTQTAAAATVSAALCAPIAPASESRWDQTCDIVIVGSGAAGLAAAVSAAQTDPDATIGMFESLETWGGNSILNQGNYGACQTDVQIAVGETDEHFKDNNPDLYFAEKCKLDDYRMDPALTRIFVDGCLDGCHWFNDLGVTWKSAAMYDETILQPSSAAGKKFHLQFNPNFENGSWIGCQTKGRHHKGAEYNGFTGGHAPMNTLYDAATASPSFTLQLNAPIAAIVRESNLSGRVLGVELTDGTRIEAARGVVLAAGGYSANIEMCRKFDLRIPASAKNTGCSGVDGSAMVATMDAGADTRGLDFIQPAFQEGVNSLVARPLFAKTGSHINVDQNGQRFWRETENKAAFRDAKVTLLHELGLETWWSIADATSAERLGITEEAIAKSNDAGTTYVANSLEDLAAQMGVPADALVKTVARWNDFVENGKDEDFGQAPECLYPIATAPFYAEERCFYVHSAPGGLCINTNTQVIDRHGEVIPGLYAAGKITGGVHGTERNGGCSWTDCTVFGRIAGAQAANAR